MTRQISVLLGIALLTIACSRIPRELADAPTPGLIGNAVVAERDNEVSTTRSFLSSSPEPELRAAFDVYCTRLGMWRNDRDHNPIRPSISWYCSKNACLGMLLAPASDGQIRVTYFFNP